jgi:hypothetical protein
MDLCTMKTRNVINKFHKYTLYDTKAQIEAYGRWVRDQIDHGWDAYIFTFEFNQLSGPHQEKMRLIREYLNRWYGRLATRTVRYPRSPKWIPFLPKAILTPDYPVPKHSKKTLMRVSINDGLHYQGPVLATRLGTRLQDTLDVHFRQHGSTYFTKELHHMDVKPVTHDPEFVVDYCMKALKNRSSPDDILIFPRAVSELPTNGPVRAAGEKPMYDFQRNY